MPEGELAERAVLHVAVEKVHHPAHIRRRRFHRREDSREQQDAGDCRQRNEQ